jgi:hypothetical protein
LEFGFASLVEIGGRVDLSRALEAGVTFYRRSRPQYGAQIQPFADPANPGDIVNINVFAKVADAIGWGPEIALDWRLGTAVSSRLVYSLNAGETSSTHAITAAGVARGQAGLLRGVEAALLLRMLSGLPYTRQNPAGGTGITARQTNLGFGSFPSEPLNSSRLPWTHFLDLRVTKSVTVGALDVRGFADFRNVLNIRNVLDLYAETGTVKNGAFSAQLLDTEYDNILREAADNNRLLPNGDINLVPNCASWTVTSGANGAVVNCVALQRAEARFGNGDGLYSPIERENAFNAFYAAFYGPQTFYGSGRSVQLGIELRW